MPIKAISFDVGHTLVRYKNPLNWKSLYHPALEKVFEKCHFDITEEKISLGISILLKYNTRENYREHEVCSDVIFKELFDAWNEDYKYLNTAKEAYYGFFQADAVCYDDTLVTLQEIHKAGIKIGVLTDVAYGMDNAFSLKDIESIQSYLDICITSVDVGFRKPNKEGYARLLQAFDVTPSEMLFVGDEDKDIIGANSMGIGSVLINRNYNVIQWGQKYTISSLLELVTLVSNLHK